MKKVSFVPVGTEPTKIRKEKRERPCKKCEKKYLRGLITFNNIFVIISGSFVEKVEKLY